MDLAMGSVRAAKFLDGPDAARSPAKFFARDFFLEMGGTEVGCG
jgi:hypothetical protein